MLALQPIFEGSNSKPAMLSNSIVFLVAVTGILVAMGLLIHPIGPALLLLATTPFDPVIPSFLGPSGNYLMAIPIGLLLFKTNPVHWPSLFLGTRVQTALFLFILVAGISHAIGWLKLGPDVGFFYLQKVTGFLLVGVFASGLRNEKYLELCVKVLVVAAAAFALLSMLEFYLNISFVPAKYAGSEFFQENPNNVNLSRLRGAGDSVPINRFALQLLVPIGLAMAWLTPKIRKGMGLLPLACLIILLTALVGTISRGAFLSLAVGVGVVAIAAYRLKPAPIIATILLATTLAFGASQTLTYLGINEAVESRLTGSELRAGSDTRQEAWLHGLRLFADSPIWGVGYGVTSTANIRPISTSPDPHNAYIRLLAFYGILGGTFFIYLIYCIYSPLLRSARDLGELLEHLRPYFLAAITSLLTMNLFNSYFFDRVLFLVIGFAAAIESTRRDANVRRPSGVVETNGGFAPWHPEENQLQ